MYAIEVPGRDLPRLHLNHLLIRHVGNRNVCDPVARRGSWTRGWAWWWSGGCAKSGELSLEATKRLSDATESNLNRLQILPHHDQHTHADHNRPHHTANPRLHPFTRWLTIHVMVCIVPLHAMWGKDLPK